MLDKVDRLTGETTAKSIDPFAASTISNAAFLSIEQGDRAWQAEQLDQALAYYRQAIELAPNNPKPYQKLAVVLKHQGKIAEASAYYRQALTLNDENLIKDKDYQLLEENNISDRPSHENNYFSPNGHGIVKADRAALKSNSEAVQIYLHQALIYWKEQQWEQTIEVCQKVLQLAPNSAEAYKIWGNALQKLGKAAEAMGYYGKAVEIQPNLAEVYANIGSLYAQQKSWQNAINYYQKAVVIDPYFVGAYRNLEKVWQQLGETDKASECNYRVLQLEPDRVTSEEHLAIADRLLEQGKLTEAIDPYKNAIKLNPNLIEAYQKLAGIFEKTEQYQKAAKYYRQSIELKERLDRTQLQLAPSSKPVKLLNSSEPNNHRQLPLLPGNSQLNSAKAYADRGTRYAQQQQWKSAIACYQEALKLDPNFAGVYRNVARILTQLGRTEQATNFWFKALSLDPSSAKAEHHYHLGNALKEQGKIEKASACYRRAIQLQANFAEAYLRLGEIFFDRSQKQPAISCYRQALTHNPNLPEGCYRLAEILATSQEWDEAIFYYRQAIVLQPNYAQTHHNLGDVLSKQEKWSEAVDAYRRAIELNPDFSWSYNNIGNVLMKLERWQEAAEVYRRSIELNPDFVWSHYNLGKASINLALWEEAIEAFENALKLKPDLQEAKQELNYVNVRRVELDLETAFQYYLSAIEQDPMDVDSYRKALEIKPDNSELCLGLAKALVARGEV